MKRGLLRTIGAAAFLALLLTDSAFAEDDAKRAHSLWNLCTSCHMFKGEGDQKIGAPSIAGLPEWYITGALTKYKNGARGKHPHDVIGMKMRPIGKALTDEDIPMMAKYVAAMPRPVGEEHVKGSLVRGEAKFQQVCVACHGAKADGNQALGAPPLVGQNDWYLLLQLKKFRAKARGYDVANDPFGVSMQGISSTLKDEELPDLVAYINALRTINN